MRPDDLLALARKVADQARAGEEIEVACSYGQSRSIRVYEGEVESLTTADNTGIGVRVLIDGREGFASAGSLDDDVITDMLAEARDNAQFAEADPYVGIARPDGVAAVAVDLWRDGVTTMPTDDKIALALELERRVRGASPAVTGVRVAGYSDNEGAFALVSRPGSRSPVRLRRPACRSRPWPSTAIGPRPATPTTAPATPASSTSTRWCGGPWPTRWR